MKAGAARMFFLERLESGVKLSPAEQALTDLNMAALMYSSTFATKTWSRVDWE